MVVAPWGIVVVILVWGTHHVVLPLVWFVLDGSKITLVWGSLVAIGFTLVASVAARASFARLSHQLIELQRIRRILSFELVIVLSPAASARVPSEAGIHLILPHVGVVVDVSPIARPPLMILLASTILLLVLVLLLILGLGKLSQLRFQS